MPIPDPPPDSTHFRVLLTDPEGTDRVELQRILEDCGLEVWQVEELSERKINLQTKKASEKAGALRSDVRKAG